MKEIDYFTVPETAIILNLSRSAVTNMITRDNIFPNAVKLNPKKKTSAWLLPKKDVRKEEKRREKIKKLYREK